MRFLVDAQLPPALSAFLVERGHLAEHVQDIGLGEAEDLTLWNYAMGCGASIITKDDDFVTRVSLGFPGPVIVWIRVGNCSNRALVGWFSSLLPSIVSAIERGDRVLEVV